MASETDICNWALSELGVATIANLDENSQAARVCNVRYEAVRDEVLRAFPWNCAQKRATLGQDSDSPSFEYDYSYALPSDCLRCRYLVDSANNIIGDDYPWRIEGRHILTDLSEVNLVYTYRLTVVDDMDSLLRAAISARLAAEIAYPLTKSNSLQEVKFKFYLMKLVEAEHGNAQEGRPRKEATDPWLTARL